MNLRKIIQEEILIFLKEDFTFDDSQKQKVYHPTSNMISNAQKALNTIKNNNLLSHGGNEGSGRDKAHSLISKKPISHTMMNRMKAFFDNNSGSYQSELSKGKTINDSGVIQSWNLWGGDSAKDWVNGEIGRLNNRNLSRKKVRRDAGIQKTSTLMDPFNTRSSSAVPKN